MPPWPPLTRPLPQRRFRISGRCDGEVEAQRYRDARDCEEAGEHAKQAHVFRGVKARQHWRDDDHDELAQGSA